MAAAMPFAICQLATSDLTASSTLPLLFGLAKNFSAEISDFSAEIRFRTKSGLSDFMDFGQLHFFAVGLSAEISELFGPSVCVQSVWA